MRKKVVVLIPACILIAVITAFGGLCRGVGPLWLRVLLLAIVNLCNAAVALVAMKITGIRADIDMKNLKQFAIGAVIALSLSLVLAFIPALCGFSLVGSHKDFSWFGVIYPFLNYFLMIGPVEELVFRVYIQETMISFFGRKKYLGVIIAAFLFGLWHLINGSWLQVLFTFGIGLVFGSCKHLIKDCKYLGLSFGHGLYDFLNEIVRLFIV